MTDIARTDDLFFTRTGMDPDKVGRQVSNALDGSDDGELFLEYSQSESITFDDGRVRNASFDTTQGFGLRAVSGEATGYAHSTELSEAAIARAGETVRAVRTGKSGTVAEPPANTNRDLYTDVNPLGELGFEEKVKLLSAFASSKTERRRLKHLETMSTHSMTSQFFILR